MLGGGGALALQKPPKWTRLNEESEWGRVYDISILAGRNFDQLPKPLSGQNRNIVDPTPDCAMSLENTARLDATELHSYDFD